MTRRHRLTQLIHILVVCFVLSTASVSADKPTPYTVIIGGGLGLNFHQTEFVNLPGMNLCCDDFKSGFGLGSSFFAGLEYKMSPLFNMPISWSVNAGYTNLYAKIKRDEFIGHIILGNTYVNGKSEHQIDPSVSVIFVEPALLFSPFKSLPLTFKIGLCGGLRPALDYKSKETLVTPSSGRFENGQKERAVTDGTADNSLRFMFGATAGVRYEIYKSNNLAFSPELQYNYWAGNIASGYKWQIPAVVRIGGILAYRIPDAKPVPPAPAPNPAFPAPPKSEDLPQIAVSVAANGQQTTPNEKITIKKRVERFFTDYSEVPTLWFKPSSDEQLSFTLSGNSQSAVFEEYAKALSVGRAGARINITAFAADNEPEGTAEKRLDKVHAILVNAGIAADNIKSETDIISVSKLRHPETAEEFAKVQITVDKANDVENISIEDVSKRKTEYTAPGVSVKVSETTGLKVTTAGTVTLPGGGVRSISGEITRVEISNDQAAAIDNTSDKTMNIRAEITDNFGNKASANTNRIFEIKLDTVIDHRAFAGDKNYEIESRSYFLGFFDFDKSAFNSINREAVEKVKQAVVEGKRIVIIPLCDKFGEEAHNDKLVDARAASALKLFPKDYDITVEHPKSLMFDNETAPGRVLSRSVIVKILNK